MRTVRLELTDAETRKLRRLGGTVWVKSMLAKVPTPAAEMRTIRDMSRFEREQAHKSPLVGKELARAFNITTATAYYIGRQRNAEVPELPKPKVDPRFTSSPRPKQRA